jgi:hypothetical protein
MDCQFYVVRREHLYSKTNSGTRNPAKPVTAEKAFCGHVESLHKQDTICPGAVCGGDITLCDIPEPHRANIQEEHHCMSA